MTQPPDRDLLEPLGATALAPFAASPDEALETIFGFEAFRAGQRRVVDRLVDGGDALAVMPTGSGKSLCYQLTAALTEGVTLVVSPLIALMKDQLDALHQTGLPATEINSSISRRERRRRIEGMRTGDYKIVYVAPERFRSSAFRRALREVEIGLFAIDEAHCISQWGHDFRPDYRRLADVRSELDEPRTVALTATATEYVQKDIVRQLDLADADVIVSGFERPNLYFEVFHARGKRDKLRRLEALIDYHDGESVIVYGATRKQVRQVCGDLDDRGIDAELYHGGMDDQARATIHDRWMAGEMPVLVATNAFGMGVDKADVRAVVHYNMPGSVEAYYQEAGRAGRDGEPAHCLLLFNYADTGIHEWFADNSYPTRREIAQVWNRLTGLEPSRRRTGPGALADRIAGLESDLHPMLVESALRQLEAAGHLEATAEGLELVEEVAADRLEVDFERLDRRRRVEKEQVEHVAEYASSAGCRQAALLRHFGTEPSFGERCGHCSDCDPPPVYAEQQADELAETVVCDDDPATVLRKVLSGIARGRGKRGATAVAGMLVGSSARSVREAGFDELSTYGILAEIRKKDATHLIDLAARHGMVRRNQYGCVLLTDRGSRVMRGDAPPPDSLARALERTIQKPSETTRTSRRSRGGSSGSDTYRRTLRLHEKGMSVSEIARERELTERTISNHLITLADRGAELDLEVDPDSLEQLREIAGDWQDGDKLRPLKQRLGWSYPKLKRHLAALLAER